MKKYNIASIPGDGTGPEVVKEAVKVLNAAASNLISKSTFMSSTSAVIGTSAQERFYRKTLPKN